MVKKYHSIALKADLMGQAQSTISNQINRVVTLLEWQIQEKCMAKLQDLMPFQFLSTSGKKVATT